MSQSAKTAIGGMITALSVVILMPTALDLFVYALPAMAGMLTMFAVIELGKKWSIGVFAAVSLISILLVPNKEAAVMYLAFFGYYPIAKAFLESKLPKVPEYICKFLLFNVSVVAAYAVLIKIFGMPFDELMGLTEDDGLLKRFAVPIMLGLGNLVFIVFDIALTRIVTVYLAVWQKKFKKLFPFK